MVIISLLPSPHHTVKLYVPIDSRGNFNDVELLEPVLVLEVFHVLLKLVESPYDADAGKRSKSKINENKNDLFRHGHTSVLRTRTF